MKKKSRWMLRPLSVVLTFCLAAAIATPMAYATTLEQEAVLATGQRSINNPGGNFAIPETLSDRRLFHPDTRQAVFLMAENVMEQLIKGYADPEAVRRIFAYAPIVSADELPPEGDFRSDLLQYFAENGINNLYNVFLPTDRPDVYQILSIYSSRNGEPRFVPWDIEYDAATGWIYGTNDSGIFGFIYDYNVTQFMLRSAPNTWQRYLGYNKLYDAVAPLLMAYIDTVRFPFSYDGRDWMIQIWKGIYGPSNGAEVGIYEKDSGRPFHWDTASDTRLDMSMQLYQGDRMILEDVQRTWWLAAFYYGNCLRTPLQHAGKLRLTGTILFEEQEMLDAFLASFEKNRPANMTGSADGLLFQYDWQAG